jgi:hypothetical protein
LKFTSYSIEREKAYNMNKSIVFCLSAVVFVFAAVSCSQSVENESLSVRSSLVSDSGGDITACVYPENTETGNIVTGAVVLITGTNNVVTELSFSNDSQCYTGTIPDARTQDYYTVDVRSALCDEISYIIPHTRLVDRPAVSLFEDSDGSSVLSGKALSCSLPVQIAWGSYGSGIVYQVVIKSGLKTVVYKSTEEASLLIPSDTFTAGTLYYISIAAQYIRGDPYFKTADYYSVSSIKSAGISFNVQ